MSGVKITPADKAFADCVKDNFSYNPESGDVFRVSTGKKCQTLRKRGKLTYYQTTIKDKSYLVHRIAFYLFYGYLPKQIDHINGIGTDNRICNLRDGEQVNSQNKTVSSKSKTGIKGVLYRKERQAYQVTLCDKYIGHSVDFFEACCIRKSAENHIGYQDRV